MRSEGVKRNFILEGGEARPKHVRGEARPGHMRSEARRHYTGGFVAVTGEMNLCGLVTVVSVVSTI